MTENRVTAVLVRRRFALLLGALGALLLIAPIFGETARGELELALLFSAVVVGLVVAADRRRRLAGGLAVLWLGLTWAVPGDEIASDIALLGLCVVTIESVLVRALTARTVDAEALSAAIAAYVLIGVAWAVAYTMLETLDPGAFRLAAAEAGRPWSALLYFSFATLTTLGYGDVTPLSLTARAWAGVQAMSGTLYLAILIARLVGIYRGSGG